MKNKNFIDIKKQKQRIKDKQNSKLADKMLSKNYTVDDVLDIKTRWNILKYTQEEQEIIQKAAELAAEGMNIAVCADVSYNKLNKLDTYENATKKGLTKNMTDEQKEILKRVSKKVSIDRVLIVSGKYTSRIAVVIASMTLITQLYWNNIYQLFSKTENIIVWSLLIYSMYCLIQSKALSKQIGKDISEIINIKTR